MNSAGDDETIMFVDAVHPTHASRSVGCWAPKEVKVAVEQNSGRQRLNIHGAVDMETGKTCMLDEGFSMECGTVALDSARKQLVACFIHNVG
jgi:hypothetical protein